MSSGTLDVRTVLELLERDQSGVAELAVLGSLAALIALAVSVGGWDLQVLTESSKSLLYRIQYWRASLEEVLPSSVRP